MLIEKLSPEDVSLAGYLHDPIALAENLFTDEIKQLDSLQYFEEDKNFKVRIFQLPFFSYEYLIANNPKLTSQENFNLKIGAGQKYIFTGRGIGKSLCQIIDLCLDTIHNCFDWSIAVSSFDDIHVANLMEPYITTLKKHPFLKNFYNRAIRNPYKVETLPNRSVSGINMTLSGREAGCLDLETEILTDNGWKKYNTIKQIDKVLSFNPETNKASYEKINKIINFNYTGDILTIKNKTVDLKLTPNHNLLFYNWITKKYNFRRADKSYYISFIPGCSKVKNYYQSQKDIKLFKRTKQSQEYTSYYISIEDWVIFLAWFISEGHITSEYQAKKAKYRICIAQSKEANPEKWNEIKELLDRIGLKYNYHGCNFSFKNKFLYKKLEKLILRGAKNKRIPRFIFKLDKKLIKLFIDTYVKGDGHYYKEKDGSVIYTSSIGLADDIQELYLLIDKNTSLITRNTGFVSTDKYMILENSRTRKCFYKNQIKKEKYDGKVWCVNTEPYHTIFIRRNGKIAIVGNSAWESHHVAKIILDEAQYETDQVIQKRSQAISEKGCIERLSGITSFTRQSPIGKIFFDIDKKNWLVNLPKTVSPFWNNELKKEATDDYGDESAPAYKIHIEAEVVENAIGLYDVDLLRRCYMDNVNRPIKHFDINKENYEFFKTRVIVEKLNYAKRVWLSADFGVTAPTEIIIIFETEDKDTKEARYKYIYNITITGLIPDQQTEFFKWLIKELDVDYVSIDCTEHGAQQILYDLNKTLPQERLISVKFNERLIIGYEKDDFGNFKLVEGKLVPIEAYVIDWAVEKTREIFYKQKINCLYDLKLDKQFSNMIAIRQANRLKYSTLLSNKEDHLHASFLVWSIARFLKAESEDSKPKRVTWGVGSIGQI